MFIFIVNVYLQLLVNKEAYVDTLCLLTQPKEGQQQFKNKKQPELTENQTVWKSNNQEVKEETYIQTGRRGRDGQLGREDSAGDKAAAGGPSKVADCGTVQARLELADPTRWWLTDPVAPHSHIDKPGGTKGEPSRPQNPRAPTRGNKASNHRLKTPWGLRRQWEKLPASQESSLERSTGSQNIHKPTHMGISTRTAHFACG